jgi:type II secretory pathway component PulJ
VKRAVSGVTLLELIIAMSLLSLLSLGILTALRVGVNAMVKSNTRLMDNRRMAGAQRILEDQIAGFMPVVANCIPAEADRPVARLPFFQGEPQSMRFVSSYSLGEGWRGLAQVLEFQVTAGAPGEGVRLVVNEHAYTGSLSAGAFCLGTVLDEEAGVQVPQFRPIVAGPRSFVLADRLASCRFSYSQTLPAAAGERWVGRWILPSWPNAVRVDMVPLEPDRARIQPLSLIAPIHVNAQPGAGYGG